MTNYNTFLYLVIVYLVCVITKINAQPFLKDPLQNYLSTFQPEKAYVHTNQYHYTPGDRIFYKIYLMSKDGPSPFTKNIFVEWYDQEGDFISRQIVPAIMGISAADFVIPQKYAGQQVHMKIYTKWMQLQNPTPFLVTSFKVLQTNQSMVSPDSSANGLKIKAQLEGGSWVKGISSVITITTHNDNNIPLGMKGRIIDAKGEALSFFSTEPYGWGQVEVTPLSSDMHFIQVEMPDGSWVQQQLPKVLENGVALKFDPIDKSFLVQRSSVVSDAEKNIFIALMHKDELLIETKVSLQERLRLRGIIRTDSFPDGFHRLIWFDSEKNVLGQRVFFLHKPQPVTLTLDVDTLSVDKKGINVFTLVSLDTLLTSLSVSVTDADFEESHPNNTIYQLMGADVFKSTPSYSHLAAKWADQQNYRAIDQWLQAQDIWYPNVSDALAGHLIPVIAEREQSYIQLKGVISNLGDRKTKKAETMNVIISAGDDRKILSMDLANDGSFQCDDLFFYDSVNMYFQPNRINLSDKNSIQISTNLQNTNTIFELPVNKLRRTNDIDSLMSLQMKYAEEKYLLDSLSRSTTLKDVVVTSRIKTRIEELDEKFTNGFFRSDGIKFNIIDNNLATVMPSVFHYLQGRIAGLNISFNPMNMPILTWRFEPVAVFLDEMQLFDLSIVSSMSMLDVAYVKVFRPPFLGTFAGGSGGAIAIYTRRGDDYKKDDISNLRKVKLYGYTKPTSWESTLNPTDDRKKPNKDIRKTLYWNPSVQLDGEVGAYRFRFNNNDVTTRFRVIAEGFNKEGKLVRFEKIIAK